MPNFFGELDGLAKVTCERGGASSVKILSIPGDVFELSLKAVTQEIHSSLVNVTER